MRKWCVGFVVVALAAFIGCSGGAKKTVGGPGASSPSNPKGEKAFTLKAPGSESLTQGDKLPVKITIDRGKDFNQDVALSFSGMPTGVTVDPASPTIKASDKSVEVTFNAAADAGIGEKTITITGAPADGSTPATSEMTLTIKKK